MCFNYFGIYFVLIHNIKIFCPVSHFFINVLYMYFSLIYILLKELSTANQIVLNQYKSIYIIDISECSPE